MKRRFIMNVKIDGMVEMEEGSEDYTLEELNELLVTKFNDMIKENLSVNLDIPKDIISVESRYE
jgi:hypothetical protein